MTGTGHVLIVEDDRSIIDLYADQMRAQGLAVYQAETGARARVLFDATSPDVVCVDGRLPDESGATLAEEFAARGARVLLMTNDQELYEHPPPGVAVAVLKVKLSPVALAAAIRGLLA